MPERRDTLFKGRPKSGLDFLNAPRQSGNRTKSPVHSMGYGLCVDVQKSGTTQIQNVLDKGYNLDLYCSDSGSAAEVLCVYYTDQVLCNLVSVFLVLFRLFSFQPCFIIFVKSCLFWKGLCDFFFNMEDFIKRII